MTAHVLGTKVILNDNNLPNQEKRHQKIPILQTGNDDLDSMKSSSDLRGYLDDDNVHPNLIGKCCLVQALE